MPAVGTCALTSVAANGTWGSGWAFWLPGQRGKQQFYFYSVCEIKRNQLPRSSPAPSGTWEKSLPWVLVKKTLEHFILAASGKGRYLLVKIEGSGRLPGLLEAVWAGSCGQGPVVIFSPGILQAIPLQRILCGALSIPFMWLRSPYVYQFSSQTVICTRVGL